MYETKFYVVDMVIIGTAMSGSIPHRIVFFQKNLTRHCHNSTGNRVSEIILMIEYF